MTILGRLALLFVIVPILELMLLIKLGQLVGLMPTLALVVLTGVGGAMLARAEGIRVFFQFQSELARGRIPGQAMLDGISVLIGGAFLLTPGVLTDFVGFSLLFPLTRRWIQKGVRRRLERQIEDGSIRVMTMGTHGVMGFGGFGRGGAAGGGPAAGGGMGPRAGSAGVGDAAARAAAQAGKDPSKGIVIEPEE